MNETYRLEESNSTEEGKPRVSANVLALGWVSFFTDVSSEMILPLLPLFLTSVLGASRSVLGVVEGIAESTASLVKLVSGWYSDRTGSPKRLVVLGYSLSNVVKPLLALCTTWPQVLALRFLDRVGKGIRTAPRDAVLAASSTGGGRGRSFGLHRAMDTAGAVVGSLIAFLVLTAWTGAYRSVFALSFLPGVLAVVLLLAFVKEPRRPPVSSRRLERREVAGYGWFLAVVGLFTVSHITYAFYILRAHDLGVSERWVPIIYMLYNVVYALLATPAGILSDRYGRPAVLRIGFLANALLLIGFGFASRTWHAWALFVFYGVVSAVIETVPRALVADLVGPSRRGLGYGAYHATVGLLPLPANAAFGYVWQTWGARWAFGGWAVLSGLSVVALSAWIAIRGKLNATPATAQRE